MISFFYFSSNYPNQEIYKQEIENLNYYQYRCKCGQNNFVKHGYYKRCIKSPLGKVILTILRIKCKSCNCTHAVLPSSIVPYSQITLSDQIEIISEYEDNDVKTVMEKNPEIDQSNVNYVIKKYINHWKERLRSIFIYISENININYLIKTVFNSFKTAFMQIKQTHFFLHPSST